MKISLRTFGFARVAKNVVRFAGKVVDEVAPAMATAGAQKLFDESEHLVPILSGDLLASGQVIPAKKNASGQWVAEARYGGTGGVDYALEVHERQDGQGGKYLTGPLKGKKKEVAEAALAAGKKAL